MSVIYILIENMGF